MCNVSDTEKRTLEEIKYAKLHRGIVPISDALAPTISPVKPTVVTILPTNDAATVDAKEDTPAIDAKYLAPSLESRILPKNDQCC